MRKSLIIVVLVICALANVFADDFPEKQNPPRLVNDFGRFLSPGEIDALESKLLSYEDSTSTQIAIVTVNDLKGYDQGDYANRLFEKWEIGQKGKDNGILILFSIDTISEKKGVFIEVGYGLESKIPDGVAKGIINETMIPYFKQGQYYQGLDVALDEIMQRASGEFKSDGKKKKNGGNIWVTLLILFVAFILFNKFRGPGSGTYSNRGYRGGGFMGGGFGGGGFGGGGGGGFGGFGGGGSGGGGAGGNW